MGPRSRGEGLGVMMMRILDEFLGCILGVFVPLGKLKKKSHPKEVEKKKKGRRKRGRNGKKGEQPLNPLKNQ